jgi:hypothetical protein
MPVITDKVKDLSVIFFIIRQENDFLYSEINTQYDQMLATERWDKSLTGKIWDGRSPLLWITRSKMKVCLPRFSQKGPSNFSQTVIKRRFGSPD